MKSALVKAANYCSLFFVILMRKDPNYPKMNKNNKASRPGVARRCVSATRLVASRSGVVTTKKAIKSARPGVESARQFVTDFYEKHGKAMSQLANE